MHKTPQAARTAAKQRGTAGLVKAEPAEAEPKKAEAKRKKADPLIKRTRTGMKT